MNVLPIPLFDTHVHLDFPEFDADRLEFLHRGFPPLIKGLATVPPIPIVIVGVLIPGIDLPSSRRIVEQAALSDRLHAAVAVHPNHTADVTDDDWQNIIELAQRGEVVAIGETGLDCYWDDSPLTKQIDMFHRHIELSQNTGKPILIHCRDAWDVLLPILRQAGKLNGVIHAFSGNAEQMGECVELGLHISFAGSVTYRNAKFASLWEAAKETPADRLLIETDAPFMIPHPLRGKLPRNEPALVALTAQRLSELRDVPLQTIAETTTYNACALFRLLNSVHFRQLLLQQPGQRSC